jgi:flavin-dependent dehydrogenase
VPYGKAWLAVGDAAISFDPLATQGIHTALESGARGAQALLVSEVNPESWQAYAQYLQDLRQQQRQALLHQYLSENRWPEQEFWAHRRHAALQELAAQRPA